MSAEFLERVEEKMEEALEEIIESEASAEEVEELLFQNIIGNNNIEMKNGSFLEGISFFYPKEKRKAEKRKTLAQIKKDTQNFTLLEKKKGFLTKKYPTDNHDLINERALNSDTICRLRYILRESTQDWLDAYLELDNAFENKIISELSNKLNQMYDELGIHADSEKERFIIDVQKMNQNHTRVSVLVSIDATDDFVKFDLDFVNTAGLQELLDT